MPYPIPECFDDIQVGDIFYMARGRGPTIYWLKTGTCNGNQHNAMRMMPQCRETTRVYPFENVIVVMDPDHKAEVIVNASKRRGQRRPKK